MEGDNWSQCFSRMHGALYVMLLARIALLLLLAASPVAAQPLPWSVFDNKAALDGSGGGPPPSYSGPGDIVGSNWITWYGLRAFNSATRGTKIANVCIPLDAACADLSSDATTGALVISTIGGSSCGIVTCTIKTWYDQSGALACAAATACNITQATIANRPQLVVSCLNGLPCAQFTGGSSQQLVSAAALASGYIQPLSLMAVANRTTFSTYAAVLVNAPTGNKGIYFFNTANNFTLFFNSFVTASALDAHTHSIVALANSAASILKVDGTDTTGDDGGDQWFADSLYVGGNNSNYLTGNIFEAGAVNGNIGSTARSSIDTNQTSYWGPF